MNSILNLGQISPSLLSGGNRHQTAHGSCGSDEWVLAVEKGCKRHWTVTQLGMTVFGSTVGSSERQETRHCWTAVSLSMLVKWVEAEQRPTTRLMSSCTRAPKNLQLPQSRPTAAHLLTLLQSVKSKTVTGEWRIFCWVCGRNCAAMHFLVCTENSLAVYPDTQMSKYLTHLSIQAARYLNNVTDCPNDCPHCSLKRLFKKMWPPTFKKKSNFWISFLSWK